MQQDDKDKEIASLKARLSSCEASLAILMEERQKIAAAIETLNRAAKSESHWITSRT